MTFFPPNKPAALSDKSVQLRARRVLIGRESCQKGTEGTPHERGVGNRKATTQPPSSTPNAQFDESQTRFLKNREVGCGKKNQWRDWHEQTVRKICTVAHRRHWKITRLFARCQRPEARWRGAHLSRAGVTQWATCDGFFTQKRRCVITHQCHCVCGVTNEPKGNG